jgi:arsenate reductase
MAEGLMRARRGDFYEVFSAGTNPSTVNPYAIKAMSRMVIDISQQYAKGIEEFINREFDYVVTVCDNAR